MVEDLCEEIMSDTSFVYGFQGSYGACIEQSPQIFILILIVSVVLVKSLTPTICNGVSTLNEGLTSRHLLTASHSALTSRRRYVTLVVSDVFLVD